MTLKARIFIDFWNFQLSLNNIAGSKYRMDWKLISPWLISHAETMINQPLSFEGTTVYISYDSKTQPGKKLRNFAMNVLDRFPGISVLLVKRKPRNYPRCPHCHNDILGCPHCQGNLERTIEKGVDTAIVTDMFKLAWENSMDVAILVSSDRDFIPAVNTLSSKGYKVINAHFPPQGMHLARTCWASIDIRQGINDLKRNP